MRIKGSVTVVFSFVFVLMFSFILSFFEMASYTARRGYHASAALLATENYFAAFLQPLYEEYHIFAREVPEGEEVVSWTEQGIAEDVAYMTVKQEGEKSLLLRSGAKYMVKEATVLTENGLEGFYSQAVTAMKYRAAPEVVNLLKEFAGMTEQADAHLEAAAAKAATDSAYARVDSKILQLMGLVDGVDIKKYEKFLGEKRVIFQEDIYVKYFCTSPGTAAQFFDRTEIYRSFLNNYENPCETLESLAKGAEELAKEMEERERAETLCRSELARIRGQMALKANDRAQLEQGRKDAVAAYEAVLRELNDLVENSQDVKRIAELAAREKEISKALSNLTEQIEQCEKAEKELKKQEEQLEKEQKELERKEKEQQQRAKALIKEEEAFVKRCKTIVEICDEAYYYVEEIRQELIKAKRVKENYERVLDFLEPVLGSEALEEYRNELGEYAFYETAEGFDFDRMKQTLLENKSLLWNVSPKISGTGYTMLCTAAESLRQEKDFVAKYSFEGLRLNYGEMSLEENLYEGVEDLLSKEVAKGFLGFLTDAELSEKELEQSYLPSGFRYIEKETDVFSMLGADMSDLLTELRTVLPEDLSVDTVVGGMADSILFHSYLATHFSDFLDGNANGALAYETEYLIAGKETDKENISSVAMRICAVRTVLQFISLYTDGERKGAAEQAALAACGIIGLPALKSVVTFLLLFVWALEEAMIDTAALLQGKKILLYPGKTGGSLAFHEILLFSKSFVLERAKEKEEKKGLNLGYNEFLSLFLYLTPRETKTYRAADLIQENLRITYRDSFRVNRCVWKLSYETDGRSYVYAYE